MYSAKQTAAGQRAVNIFVEKYNDTRPAFYGSAPITAGQFLARSSKYDPIIYLGIIGAAIETNFNYDENLVRAAFESLALWSALSIPGTIPDSDTVLLKLKYTPIPLELPELPTIPGWVLYAAGGALGLVLIYIVTSRVKQLAGAS